MEAQGPDMAAQMAANPISATARMMFQRDSRNMIAAAELMPAEKYGFHPTEPQMTFGKLVAHISQTNEFLCAAIAGTPLPAPPTSPKETDSKDVLVKGIKDSFDHCSAALQSLTDTRATETIALGPQKVARVYFLMVLIADWADHYSTQASYLRLNGLVPPSAQAPTGR
jgi:hypothetical protein